MKRIQGVFPDCPVDMVHGVAIQAMQLWSAMVEGDARSTQTRADAVSTNVDQVSIDSHISDEDSTWQISATHASGTDKVDVGVQASGALSEHSVSASAVALGAHTVNTSARMGVQGATTMVMSTLGWTITMVFLSFLQLWCFLRYMGIEVHVGVTLFIRIASDTGGGTNMYVLGCNTLACHESK